MKFTPVLAEKSTWKPTPRSREIAEALTDLGLEVEGVRGSRARG